MVPRSRGGRGEGGGGEGLIKKGINRKKHKKLLVIICFWPGMIPFELGGWMGGWVCMADPGYLIRLGYR